jgi:Zn-finger nucleic acid-binding protein
VECPACGKQMEEMTAGDILVDVCKGGCGGIWFDRFELQKVDEPHESVGETLLDVEKDESTQVDHTERRKCPTCKDKTMMRHFYSVKKDVELDECPNCGGFWLDSGELGQIRSQYKSEEERKKAAEEYFSVVFGKELAKMLKESKEKSEKAKKIAQMFRFICPSYYIPGKQDWGAF